MIVTQGRTTFPRLCPGFNRHPAHVFICNNYFGKENGPQRKSTERLAHCGMRSESGGKVQGVKVSTPCSRWSWRMVLSASPGLIFLVLGCELRDKGENRTDGRVDHRFPG